MAKGPSAAAKVVEKYIDIVAPPRRAVAILADIIVGEGWSDQIGAGEKAETWRKPFLSYLKDRMSDPYDLGWITPLTFNAASDDYLQGSCFCEPNDAVDVIDAKNNRANTYRIYNFIKNLHHKDIEKLCGKMLSLLGVVKPHVSSQSNDGGVDFYGYAPFGSIIKEEILPHGVEKQLNVWFIGQAKHYPDGSISTNEIRELVGSADLARAKVFATKKDPLEHLTAKLCAPIFSIIATTGRFSHDSVILLSKAGIIGMDGPLIGQLLADHGIGIAAGNFNPDDLTLWLNSG